MSPTFSLEKATVVSQGREPLGTECVPRTKSPEGATEPSIDLPPLRGLAIGLWHPVQGLAPLANDFRPVPGLGTTRLDARNRREVILALFPSRGDGEFRSRIRVPHFPRGGPPIN